MFSLRKELRNHAQYNAFSDSFDVEALKMLVQKAKENNADKKDISLANITPFFNDVYDSGYKIIKETISSSSLTISELEELLLSNFNRTIINIRNEAAGQINKKIKDNDGKFSWADYGDLTVKNSYTGDDVAAFDGMDNSLDGLNLIISYLRYMDDINAGEIIDEEQAMRAIAKLNMFSNSLVAYKSCYDGMVWQERFPVYKTPEHDALLVSPGDRELAFLLEVGKFRMGQNIEVATKQAAFLAKNGGPWKNELETALRIKRKPRHVTGVTVSNGYLIPNIGKGYSKAHLIHDMSARAQTLLYYEFAEEIALPLTQTLKVKDVGIMYAELVELVAHIADIKYPSEGKMSYDDMYTIPFRIEERKLIDFYRVKTKYTDSEIKSFIKLITHENEGGRINFWARPFVKRGDDLLFPILPIASSHLLYIVDEWFKAGGYSLDDRGPLFEKYIKDSLAHTMAEKGFYCRIHPLSDLYHGKRKQESGRKKEQVDLIAEFKSCILIAEIKCIGYPIEMRERYNAYKRITEGAKQLQRKVEFIEQHKEHFALTIPGLLTKPIVKLVIVNYPLYSGSNTNGIPTCDITFLKHYISDGRIDKGVVVYDGKIRDASKAQRLVYYSNEDEFCQNLPLYLAKPVFVETMREHVSWHVDEVLPGISAEYAKVDSESFLK